MKTLNRKTTKPPSRFAQFIRFSMLGVCLGCGVMILKLATFSQISMYLAFQLQLTHWTAAILVHLLEWSDSLLLAPVLAYFAGRVFMSNKWKFVVSMFVGIQIFPFAIIFADGAGISLIELGFRLAIIALGMALSILTFGRGTRAALAQESLPPGESPTAPQPLPQPLSQIDFEAVSKALKEEEAMAGTDASATAGSDSESAVPVARPVESNASNAARPEADAMVDGVVVAEASVPVESAPLPAPSAELPASESATETAGEKAS